MDRKEERKIEGLVKSFGRAYRRFPNPGRVGIDRELDSYSENGLYEYAKRIHAYICEQISLFGYLDVGDDFEKKLLKEEFNILPQ